jgi:proline dehydrogenase
MQNNPSISLENTELAFQYKSNNELKAAKFLFSLMAKPLLVKWGSSLTPWAVQNKFPIKGILRKTIFRQFVGGETLEETAKVAMTLGKYNVQVMLDYAKEGTNGSEAEYDYATRQFIKVANYAATQPNIPFISVKVTSIIRFGLLEKLDELMLQQHGSLVKRYLAAVENLDNEQKEEWHRVRFRLIAICEAAAEKKIGVFIDAEETWIQDPVDALVTLMMDMFNKNRVVIGNTIQLYRHDRLRFLYDCFDTAEERDFILGMKLVRGAYMEKERKHAQEHNYPSPIQPDKPATDKDFNDSVRFCIEHFDRICTIISTHNEESNLLGAQLLKEKGLPANHPHVHFSQLYGMSDNITFNLANAGCNVSKYLPFGSIEVVISYLMRRAKENTSVKGQTTRELALIDKEIKRRGI